MELHKFDLTEKAIFRRKLSRITVRDIPFHFQITRTEILTSFIDGELYGLGKLNSKFQTKSQIKPHEKANHTVIGSLREMAVYRRYENRTNICDCCGRPIFKQVGLCRQCENDLHNKLNYIVRRIKDNY
jgi:hypothetical protein